MAKSVEALVEPQLLVWAREKAGFAVEGAARKIAVKPDRLVSWEAGKARPTVKQLRKLSNVYKRPLAVFFLPKPPKDFQPLRDFRRFPERIAGTESPELRLEIRRARERRRIAIELYEDLQGEPPEFSFQANLSDDAEKLAIRTRDALGATRELQGEFKTAYDAFKWWRSALENIGVLVFQAVGVELSEIRAFSISERPLPVVVVNRKDWGQPRIFSMVYELVHVMLDDGGLCCDLEEATDRPSERQRVEAFCNRVAGAVLVPKELLMSEDIVLQKQSCPEWSADEIQELAKRYKVSREVLLRRLLICDRTSKEFYQKKRAEFRKAFEEAQELSEKSGKKGYMSRASDAISTAGPSFVRLVLSSYYQENITVSDLSDLLGVRLKHIDSIESKVLGSSIELGALS